MARDRLIDQVLDHVLLMGVDVDRLLGAAAAANQLNRTDLRALQALRRGGMTAGQLARALNVTSGATTRVIDSLAGAGHVVRTPDAMDRRRVVVQLTPAAERIVERTLERPLAELRSMAASHDEEELARLVRLLSDLRSLVRASAARMSRLDNR